jgi:hypothetical protein
MEAAQGQAMIGLFTTKVQNATQAISKALCCKLFVHYADLKRARIGGMDPKASVTPARF